ncbi:tetratricopeptide repeat protein [Cellulophaga baltica]|uniref:tetratricopeptide repeat protein n=1 Tax=Cellulophaga baltica TaxID=76594 RepID=UPI0037C750A6
MINFFRKNKRFVSEKGFKENTKNQSEMNGQTLGLLSQHGVTEQSELKLDYSFYTNKNEKAEELNSELKAKQYETSDIVKEKKYWRIHGWTRKIKMDNNSIDNWTTEMCQLGYKHDCEFDGWGTIPQQDEKIDVPEELSEMDCFDKGLEFWNNSEFEKSEAYYSKAIELNPNKSSFYYNRGIARGSRKNLIGEIEDYNKALEINPDYEEVYCNRGTANDELGNYQEALNDYNQSIKLNPDKSNSYRNKGNTFYRIGEKEKACEQWKKALELGDKSVKKIIEQYCE